MISMDTTVDALKNLYVALGGSADDVVNIVLIPDMINAITTVAASVKTAATTAELPAVTTANNGKVLKVVSGKWAIGDDAIE